MANRLVTEKLRQLDLGVVSFRRDDGYVVIIPQKTGVEFGIIAPDVELLKEWLDAVWPEKELRANSEVVTAKRNNARNRR